MSAKSTKIESATHHEAMTRRLTKKREMTDAEIDAAAVADSDWAEVEPIDWSHAEVVVPPKKQAISIRLDQDLIDYFKSQGPGYQRRINAVLRSYVKERSAG